MDVPLTCVIEFRLPVKKFMTLPSTNTPIYSSILYVCLSIHPFIHSIYPPIHLSIHPPIHPSIYHIHLFIHSIYPSIYPPIHLSIYQACCAVVAGVRRGTVDQCICNHDMALIVLILSVVDAYCYLS
jgi:hypothetical protein